MMHWRLAYLCVSMVLLTGCTGLPSKIDPPSVSLADVRLVDMNLMEQTFALKLRVQNPNTFDIPVHGLNYQVELNGQQLARGVNDQSVTLPGLGEEIVEVQAITSLNSLLQQLTELARTGNPSVSYRIKGNLRVGSSLLPLPFDQSGEVGLDILPLMRTKPPAQPRYLRRNPEQQLSTLVTAAPR